MSGTSRGVATEGSLSLWPGADPKATTGVPRLRKRV